MCVGVCVRACVCGVGVCARACGTWCVCIRTCACVRAYACECVRVCVYMHTCVSVCVRLYVCMYMFYYCTCMCVVKVYLHCVYYSFRPCMSDTSLYIA